MMPDRKENPITQKADVATFAVLYRPLAISSTLRSILGREEFCPRSSKLCTCHHYDHYKGERKGNFLNYEMDRNDYLLFVVPTSQRKKIVIPDQRPDCVQSELLAPGFTSKLESHSQNE